MADDGDSIMETLRKMREVMKPVFDKQNDEWADHGPAALASIDSAGLTLGQYGGNCPVQIEGDIDGKRFYFRARGEHWSFSVADTDDAIFSAPDFHTEREYGDQFEAGWMPLHEAMAFVVEAAAEYRATLPHPGAPT